MTEFSALVSHFEKFAAGADRSVQWAKDAESLLDNIEKWDELLDKIQECLSLYRPEGGPHLVDEKAMEAFVLYALARLKARDGSFGGVP